ncbi:MAG: DUF6364 family protein [Daejeonella sp.]
MKSKLNITIDQEILEQMKRYAIHQKMSISEIVENYFRAISNPKPKNSLVEMIDKLPKPAIEANINLKEEYYKAKAEKYGL